MGVRLQLPTGTVEDLEARVQLDQGAGDPTAYTVEYALIATDTVTPASGDWIATTWVAGGPPYLALVPVVGTAGAWRCWLRITAGAETILRRVGIVEFS